MVGCSVNLTMHMRGRRVDDFGRWLFELQQRSPTHPVHLDGGPVCREYKVFDEYLSSMPYNSLEAMHEERSLTAHDAYVAFQASQNGWSWPPIG